jgi:hypothetical protein
MKSSSLAVLAAAYGHAAFAQEIAHTTKTNVAAVFDCPAGEAIVSSAGGHSCAPCSAGRFKAFKGDQYCAKCPLGKVQPDEGSTGCVTCPAGTYGSEQNSCITCPFGSFQPFAGQRGCIKCDSASFNIGDSAEQDTQCANNCATGTVPENAGSANCVAPGMCEEAGADCTAVCAPGWWTEDKSGQSSCVEKPKNCKAGGWDSWSACSGNCGVGNTQTRVKAVSQVKVGTGESCETLHSDDHTIEFLSANQEWQQTRGCNSDACAINCKYHTWGDWSTTCQDESTNLAKHCGGGIVSRYRAVKVMAANGGVPCLESEQIDTAPCNSHDCATDNMNTCANDHVRCSVVAKHYTPCDETTTIADTTDTQFGGVQQCGWRCDGSPVASSSQGHDNGWNGDGNSGVMPGCSTFCNAGRVKSKRQADCHTCDSQAECAIKDIAKAIQITHDHKNSYVKSNFKCARDGADSCKCACDQHPTGCFERAKDVVGTPIVGNTHVGLVSMNQCSNYCTNNPTCGAWSWTAGDKCHGLDRTGKLTFTTTSGVSTYSGEYGASTDSVNGKPIYDKINMAANEENFFIYFCKGTWAITAASERGAVLENAYSDRQSCSAATVKSTGVVGSSPFTSDWDFTNTKVVKSCDTNVCRLFDCSSSPGGVCEYEDAETTGSGYKEMDSEYDHSNVGMDGVLHAGAQYTYSGILASTCSMEHITEGAEGALIQNTINHWNAKCGATTFRTEPGASGYCLSCGPGTYSVWGPNGEEATTCHQCVTASGVNTTDCRLDAVAVAAFKNGGDPAATPSLGSHSSDQKINVNLGATYYKTTGQAQ